MSEVRCARRPPPVGVTRARRDWFALACLAGVVVAGTLARLPGLDRALTDRHGFRQTQTAFAIREFARHGPDLLHPPLPIFGAPWSVWLEFPLPQAVASMVVRAGLSSDVAGRLLGTLSLQVTAVLLFFLVRRWASTRAALIAVVLLEAAPLSAQFGFASLIEFSATSFALATVLALGRWLDEGEWWWWCAAAACSALAFVVKVTTATAWVLPLVAVAFVTARVDWRDRWRRAALGLVAAPGIGLVAEAWWGSFANARNAASPFTRYLVFSSERSVLIGSLQDRLVWAENAVILQRIGDLVTGRLGVLALAVVVIALGAQHRLVLLSLATVPVVAVELWFPLYVVHDYYLCATLPALAAVVATGIDVGAAALGRAFRGTRARVLRRGFVPAAGAFATGGVLAAAWLSPGGQRVVANLQESPRPPGAAAVLRANTPPQARIITVGCSWDPRILYYADRFGLMYLPKHPRLSAQFVVENYSYVLTCRGQNALRALPSVVAYVPIAPGLFRIAGTTREPARVSPS